MTKRDGSVFAVSLRFIQKMFYQCSKILHFLQGKSAILKIQSGSNEEKLMPWQSLRITRQFTCDTLRNPEKGQMTYRRLILSRLIFLRFLQNGYLARDWKENPGRHK